jgi:precorrin-6A/cobalt-precorrin-6A reductase
MFGLKRRKRQAAKVLLLGGTEEARDLAEAIVATGAELVTSLAGRTTADYPGTMRVGGFGGEDGIVRTLEEGGFTVLVDASHPFAATISPAAKRAARRAKVPYLRLERRPWRRAYADRWNDVASLEEAAEDIDSGATVFLAVGAGGIAPFLHRRDLKLVVRSIEPPDLGNRHDVVVIRDRGPFDAESERALWDKYRFDALVTKNSGGDGAAAKLVVARERRTLVYMVRRPRGQPWPAARTVQGMMRRLRRYL